MTDLKSEDLVKLSARLRHTAAGFPREMHGIVSAMQVPTGFSDPMLEAADALDALLADRARMEKALREAEQATLQEIDTRDAYESAVQDLDLATGGDGEFRVSTDPGRNTPDPVAMCKRISARFARMEKDIEAQRDTIDGLDSDLFAAVAVAYRRGAVEWVRLNYPKWLKRLSSTPSLGASQ